MDQRTKDLLTIYKALRTRDDIVKIKLATLVEGDIHF